MDTDETGTKCVQISGKRPENPTLIEGLPGHGLVASIAVDQITTQLDLVHHASVQSDEFPPVVTFDDGLVHDLVRVYAGHEPPVMTLQSDLALPPGAYKPLSKCILSELTDGYKRAIFLAGAPAQREEQIGEVTGVATTDSIRSMLTDADIPLADEHGIVGGITGALVRECYQVDVPAALLIVRAHPQLPDPGAAKSVIENALEPLVEFDIDTTELEKREEEIQRQLQQVAEHFERTAEEQRPTSDPRTMGMYQ